MANADRKKKKELRTDISKTLITSLSRLKDGMGEKKFHRNIKKASKLLIADFNVSKATAVQNKTPDTF